MQNLSKEDFARMFLKIQRFIDDVLCRNTVDDDLYVEGSSTIEFHTNRERQISNLNFQIHTPEEDRIRPYEFEEGLYDYLQSLNKPLLPIVGGLGSGKTTTINYIVRRFNARGEQVRSLHSCECNPCVRRPLVIDFLHLASHVLNESPITRMFRHIRMEIFKKLISEWLEKCGIDENLIIEEDPNFLVLRRLLIANDFLHFHGAEFPQLTKLNNPALKLHYNLLSSKSSLQELFEMIKEYKTEAQKYEVKLREISDSPDNSQDFLTVALRLYLSKCNPKSPMNLIILDNLDALTTKDIEEAIDLLHNIANRVPHLRLLMPLRPSSINPARNLFVSNILCWPHFGPNNFKMILNRLERYVLNKTREELRLPNSEDNPDNPFITPPEEHEIDALLVVCYLYARIMNAGYNWVSQKGHEDESTMGYPHRELFNHIKIGRGANLGLAQTADALVGVCCRYGLDLFRRYITNAYQNYHIIHAAATISNLTENQYLTLGYPEIISCFFLPPSGHPEKRVVNLFKPTYTRRMIGWPTLVKLQLLSLLSEEKRLDIESIVRRLGFWGIPAELTIDALNNLQNKFRLLIWLSTNQRLDFHDSGTYSHDAVISEHGEGYFKRMVGDFEYLWYCATDLQKTYADEELKLSAKLNEYRLLIDRVGQTEWKQISFYRLRKDYLDDRGTTASRTQILHVLYSSLGRALLGASIAMMLHGDRKQVSDVLRPLIKDICGLILFWQERYKIAFGSDSYVDVYRERINDLQHDISQMEKDYPHSFEEISDLLDEIRKSWPEEARELLPVKLSQLDTPFEEVVYRLLNNERGPEAGFQSFLETIGSQYPGISAERFVKFRYLLVNILSKSMPTYLRIQSTVSDMLYELKMVLQSQENKAFLTESARKWCHNETAYIEEFLKDLKENAYDVPDICNKENMDKLKICHNNIIDLLVDFARRLGVIELDHLRENKWRF